MDLKESSGECLALVLTVITKASLSFFQNWRNSQKAFDVSVTLSAKRDTTRVHPPKNIQPVQAESQTWPVFFTSSSAICLAPSKVSRTMSIEDGGLPSKWYLMEIVHLVGDSS
jgi:hypothetical protein